MSRILVAGATGYLGRFVAAEFKRRGDWVRVLARNPDKLAQPGGNLEPAIDDQVDDVFVGQATHRESLAGLCREIDCVFSSIGITRQRDRVSFMDVDYQANRNILDEALAAGVRQFIFVHVFQAELMPQIEMAQARARFVAELREADIASTVICPTGYFSDMAEFFHMAEKGTVYLIGNGDARINPIHGADLAQVCVDAARDETSEVAAGGPQIYTHRQIAELAFDVLGKPPRIRRVPVWLVRAALGCVRPFHKRLATLGRFMLTVSLHDFVAPSTGERSLREFFEELRRM